MSFVRLSPLCSWQSLRFISSVVPGIKKFRLKLMHVCAYNTFLLLQQNQDRPHLWHYFVIL